MEALQSVQEAPLAFPSAEVVLDKVKSDGTFDQFRKTCLAAVEAEPSMRAYGEQIEVLSRRYLQDHHHKWSDSITKNEVRAKLKDYIIKMIANPDVGISIPVQNMVENSLEKNGPKILLPQIVDAVTALQETAREEAAKSTTDSSPPKQVDSTSAASGKSNPEMGTLDLPLPIIIPGLNVGTKKEGGGGESGVKSSKKESAADPSKAKAKTKASVESSGGAVGGNKEAKQGLAKGAPQKASLGKAIGNEKTKQKEKDSRSPIDEKEESKEVSPQNEDDQSKEKGRGLASGKVKKTPREEKLDQKEKESEKHPDRKGKESTIADLKEVAKKESSGKKEKDLKDGNKSECTALDQTTGQDVISKEDPEDSKHSIEDEVEVKGPVTGGSGGRGRRKQLAPKRRSARLASLNEESPDEQTANEKAKSSTEEVNIDTSEATVLQETGKKKASAVTVVEKEESAATLRPSGHKRLCVLESNSDEESVTTHQTSSEEEKGYESETEQSKEEEVRKRKRKRAREGMKRGGNREAVQSHLTDTSKRLGQKRSLDACRDDQERRSNSPVTKKVKKNNGKQSQDETKLSPAKQKSPSPVVVTRYNRRVKPNRRYNTSPGHDSASSLSNDETEQSQNTNTC